MIKQNQKISFIAKAFFVTICLISMSTSTIAFEKNHEMLDKIIMNYSFDQPTIQKQIIGDVLYDNIVLPGISNIGNPGEPCLPIKGAYILLPKDTTVDYISITSSDKSYLGTDYYVKPVGEIVPYSKIETLTHPTPDNKIYSSNKEFPGVLYEQVGIYNFRGYSILVLDLYPIQYAPLSGDLFYFEDITVTINLKEKNIENSLFRNLKKDEFEVMKKVDNPDIAKTYIKSKTSYLDEYDLLILTTDNLKDAFEPLKNAHDLAGTSTVIKTLTDVGGSGTEDIRNYIIDAYTNWGIDYVLLGGDSDVVTARILWVFGLDEDVEPYETYMPSDLYYACLDGPYNYDGDNKWGEPTDGEGGGDVDLIAEVYVGRACVDNVNEVNNFVSKTISYINKDPEDEYLTRVCLAGEYLGNYGASSWGGNHLDQLIDVCSDDGYTTVGISSEDYDITTLYDRDWSGNDWPKSEIMNIINNNVHIVNHDGHAYYGYNMKMNNEDVFGLTNDKYCFMYSHGCMSGGFDNPDGYDCIAEFFTVKTDTAAYAAIMNARYGWFWSFTTDGDAQRFNREFWDAVYSESMPEVGKANQDSKEDNLHILTRSCIRWTYYQLNLFGDPTLPFINEPHQHPEIEIGDITSGFGINLNIKNTGDAAATDVEYVITITGGIFELIDKTFTDIIPIIDPESEFTVETDLFLGLGPIEITVSAMCNEGPSDDRILNGKQLFIYTILDE